MSATIYLSVSGTSIADSSSPVLSPADAVLEKNLCRRIRCDLLHMVFEVSDRLNSVLMALLLGLLRVLRMQFLIQLLNLVTFVLLLGFLIGVPLWNKSIMRSSRITLGNLLLLILV
jgi:hypothetical protein